MKSTLAVAIVLVVLISQLTSTSVHAQKPRRRTPPATATRQSSVLSVEAGLVFKSGDVKPVARATFHLLDKSLEDILNEAEVRDTSRESIGDMRGVKLFAFLSWKTRKYGGSDNTLAQAEDAIKPHIIATMTTDFGGKGEFPAVKTGGYFIMGVGGPAGQAVVWNMPVTLKAGKQSITLDQDNAAEIF